MLKKWLLTGAVVGVLAALALLSPHWLPWPPSLTERPPDRELRREPARPSLRLRDRSQLRQDQEALLVKGRPIPEKDLWIAATAVQHGLTLVSSDGQHFADIEELSLESW
jgi:tRNA(fMet)-specific endonuclease VapC